jgi:Uma2 family endonuclease
MRETPHGRRWMTLEEYLSFEERSPTRHEYVAGEIYAMSGATLRHGRIVTNIVVRLHGASRPGRCSVVAAEVKVRVADRVYYPDVMVACGRAAEVELIVEEPTVLVEVTSPSTRATDRREKLEAYTRLTSLRCYLIVDQRRKHVLAYTRDAGGAEWARDEYTGDGTIDIPVLDIALGLDEIYDEVPLRPVSVGEESEDEAAEADAL